MAFPRCLVTKACKPSTWLTGGTGNVWRIVYVHRNAWHTMKYLTQVLTKPAAEFNISQNDSPIPFSVRFLGTGPPS